MDCSAKSKNIIKYTLPFNPFVIYPNCGPIQGEQQPTFMA